MVIKKRLVSEGLNDYMIIMVSIKFTAVQKFMVKIVLLVGLFVCFVLIPSGSLFLLIS